MGELTKTTKSKVADEKCGLFAGVGGGIWALQTMRPMYYHWPHQPAAYDASGEAGCAGGLHGGACQYMLGGDLLVAPVLSAARNDSSLAGVRTWLPPGVWVERHSGTVVHVREVEVRHMNPAHAFRLHPCILLDAPLSPLPVSR